MRLVKELNRVGDIEAPRQLRTLGKNRFLMRRADGQVVVVSIPAED